MPIPLKSNSVFSFLPNFFARVLSRFTGRRSARIEAPDRRPLGAARAAPFDTQVARRMTQLESEVTRLVESQHAAREERIRLSQEVARLREESIPLAAEEHPHSAEAGLPEAH